MVLPAAFSSFVAGSPVSVLVQGALERAIASSQLDALFDGHAEQQYTRSLLFSTAVDLLTQVVLGARPSVCAAFQAEEQAIPVSLTSLYNKLNGVEPAVSAELVRHSARQLGQVVHSLGGACRPWLPGYRIRILDGNHFAATEHRLKETRNRAARLPPAISSMEK